MQKMINEGMLVTWKPQNLFEIFGGKKEVARFPFKPPITGFITDIHGDTGILKFQTEDQRREWIFVRLSEIVPAGCAS